MIEQTGFNDVQKNVLQRGLYTWDIPHRFTVGDVYQLPFGRGRSWWSTSRRAFNLIISGWENTWMLQWNSGRPWDLPGNVLYVKEAKLDAPTIYGVKPCVAPWNDNNTITMQSFSVAAGCTDYNFLILPRYAPRLTSYRDGRLRLHSGLLADASLNKTTKITEKITVQLRAEASNVFNTFIFARENFNNNPDSSSFGSISKAAIAFGNSNWPRYAQLAVKFLW